jgi:glycosyltransferase involved in cell wall biosynthesis
MPKKNKTLPIALVIPWFGKTQTGGAEQQAYQLATQLLAHGIAIEVLTTCSRSFFHDWQENYYSAGLSHEDGVGIRRFSVDKRDAHKFNTTVAKLLALPAHNLHPGIPPLQPFEERHYCNEAINSQALLHYLAESQHCYRCFIFLPYLFPLLQKGIALVGKKAILQPCLHDECYAYLQTTIDCVARCSMLFFNSQGEYTLARRLFGEWIAKKSRVVGEGISEEKSTPSQITSPIDAAYVLYLGKKCQEKNIALLISAFDEYRFRGGIMKLVMAGAQNLPESLRRPYLVEFGFVSAEEKSQLLVHCQALAMPSVNESFSRVVYEAWLMGKPVIVHSQCLATFEALRAAEFSGWAGASTTEWAEIFSTLEKLSEHTLAIMGEKGRRFAHATTAWSQVISRYKTAFDRIDRQPAGENTRPPFITINEIAGDNISISQFKKYNQKEVNILLADDYISSEKNKKFHSLLSLLYLRFQIIPHIMLPLTSAQIKLRHLKKIPRLSPYRLSILPIPDQASRLTQVLLADILLIIDEMDDKSTLPLTCQFHGVPVLWVRERPIDSQFIFQTVISEGKTTSEIAMMTKMLVENSPVRRLAQEQGYANIARYQSGWHQQHCTSAGAAGRNSNDENRLCGATLR